MKSSASAHVQEMPSNGPDRVVKVQGVCSFDRGPLDGLEVKLRFFALIGMQPKPHAKDVTGLTMELSIPVDQATFDDAMTHVLTKMLECDAPEWIRLIDAQPREEGGLHG